MLGDEDVHHLARVLRLRPRRGGGGLPTVGAAGPVPPGGATASSCSRAPPGSGGDGTVQVEAPADAGADRGLRPDQGRASRVGGPEADRARDRPHRRRCAASAAWCAGPGSGARPRSSACAGSPGRRRPSAGGSGCPRWPTPSASRSWRALGAPGEVALAQLSGDRPTLAQRVVAVGPEGGWSSDELGSGLSTVGFGLSVLRAETAAVDRRGAHGLAADGYRGASGRNAAMSRGRAGRHDATTDCLFCRIVAGEVSADIVYETERTVAFKDINPARRCTCWWCRAATSPTPRS